MTSRTDQTEEGTFRVVRGEICDRLFTTLPLAPDEDAKKACEVAVASAEVWKAQGGDHERNLVVEILPTPMPGHVPVYEGKALFFYVAIPPDEGPDAVIEAATKLIEYLEDEI